MKIGNGFKSKVGLDATETSRADAFCHYTILNDDLLEIGDATEDEKFRENPFVTGDAYSFFMLVGLLLIPRAIV